MPGPGFIQNSCEFSGFEPGTFKSSVWRSPNWAISANHGKWAKKNCENKVENRYWTRFNKIWQFRFVLIPKEYPYDRLVSKNRNRTKDYQDSKLVHTGKCDCKRKFLNQLLPIAYTKKNPQVLKVCRDPGLFRNHASSPYLNQGTHLLEVAHFMWTGS